MGAPEDSPDPLAPPQPDWLRHELTISGATDDLANFRAAARGAGVIPWRWSDFVIEEEDRVHALITPPDGSRGMTPAAARVLARLLRAAEEAHAERLAHAAEASTACPFDLYALIPLPPSLLGLGPEAAASRAWMRLHWGVVRPLRRVRLVADLGEDRRRRRAARLSYDFWSADWSPWAALATLRTRWPALLFDCRPDYRDG